MIVYNTILFYRTINFAIIILDLKLILTLIVIFKR